MLSCTICSFHPVYRSDKLDISYKKFSDEWMRICINIILRIGSTPRELTLRYSFTCPAVLCVCVCVENLVATNFDQLTRRRSTNPQIVQNGEGKCGETSSFYSYSNLVLPENALYAYNTNIAISMPHDGKPLPKISDNNDFGQSKNMFHSRK